MRETWMAISWTSWTASRRVATKRRQCGGRTFRTVADRGYYSGAEILACHEAGIVVTLQKRLDKNPQAMRQRRETAEHPFATLKMRMGATHFLMKRLPKVATEMALHVLAYNLTRVMNIMGIQPLMAAIQA